MAQPHVVIIGLPDLAPPLSACGYRTVHQDTPAATAKAAKTLSEAGESYVVIGAGGDPAITAWSGVQAASGRQVLLLTSERYPLADPPPGTRTLELPVTIDQVMGAFGAPERGGAIGGAIVAVDGTVGIDVGDDDSFDRPLAPARPEPPRPVVAPTSPVSPAPARAWPTVAPARPEPAPARPAAPIVPIRPRSVHPARPVPTAGEAELADTAGPAEVATPGVGLSWRTGPAVSVRPEPPPAPPAGGGATDQPLLSWPRARPEPAGAPEPAAEPDLWGEIPSEAPPAGSGPEPAEATGAPEPAPDPWGEIPSEPPRAPDAREEAPQSVEPDPWGEIPSEPSSAGSGDAPAEPAGTPEPAIEPDPWGEIPSEPPTSPPQADSWPEVAGWELEPPRAPDVGEGAPAPVEPDPWGEIPSEPPAGNEDAPANLPSAPPAVEPDPWGEIPSEAPAAPLQADSWPEVTDWEPEPPHAPGVGKEAPAPAEPDPWGEIPSAPSGNDPALPEASSAQPSEPTPIYWDPFTRRVISPGPQPAVQAPAPTPTPGPQPAVQAPAPTPTPGPQPAVQAPAPTPTPGPQPAVQAPAPTPTSGPQPAVQAPTPTSGPQPAVQAPAPVTARPVPTPTPAPAPVAADDPFERTVDGGLAKTRSRLAPVVVVFAGKGGVGKSGAAIQIAYRAAAVGGLDVAIIDLSRGQGDIRHYLRVGQAALPSVYDAALAGNPLRAISSPEEINAARKPGLPEVPFAAALAPSDTQGDPSFVTSEVYREVIAAARARADLVVVDTQIIESHDTSGLIEGVVVPLLGSVGGWGVGLFDASTPGMQNLVRRYRSFDAAGIGPSRLMAAFTRVPHGTNLDIEAISAVISRYAHFLGAVHESPAVSGAHEMGRFPADAELDELVDRILARVTGIAAFDSDRGRDRSGRRSRRGDAEQPRRGLFGRRKGR